MTLQQRKQNVLIVGATSAIARELCARLARRGWSLLLAARDQDELQRIAGDLRVRYSANVFVVNYDALDPTAAEAFWNVCREQLSGQVDGVVVCHGYLPPQRDSQQNQNEIRQTMAVNLTSVIELLTPIANWMETRRGGWLAVVSSVAGDRGRQSNYLYGASKAGLSTFLQGLRNRLHSSGVHVLTVKPGIVATPMTDGLVDPSSPLVSTPEVVARDIERAILRRRDCIYTPWFWRPIMTVIRTIPEAIFKRMKL